jgi:hypothetical protein
LLPCIEAAHPSLKTTISLDPTSFYRLSVRGLDAQRRLFLAGWPGGAVDSGFAKAGYKGLWLTEIWFASSKVGVASTDI